MRVALLILMFAINASAQPEIGGSKLVVGIKEAPPFAIRTADGSWEGISVELWDRIAAKLERDFEWREFTLEELLDATADGQVDVALGALTMTADREKEFDFSHPFHNAGLAIAVPSSAIRQSPWRALISWRFLRAVGALAFVLFVVGFLVWLFERRRNPDQFGGPGVLGGVGQGFWWSAVTMTTVGYGDRTPTTPLGRMVAIVWMFASVIVIATFTGAIASSLTVQHLVPGLEGPEDLPGHRVGALSASTAEAYLRSENITTLVAEDEEELVRLIRNGQVDAVVHDAPLLQFLARNEGNGSMVVLPRQFQRQDYALGLPTGSLLRETVNRFLLEITASDEWSSILSRYLGP